MQKTNDSLGEVCTYFSAEDLGLIVQSVRDDRVELDSFVVLTNKDAKWNLWRNCKQFDQFSIRRVLSPHQLLRNGEYLHHRCFVVLDECDQCSLDSLIELLNKRIEEPFCVLHFKEDLDAELIQRFFDSQKKLNDRLRVRRAIENRVSHARRTDKPSELQSDDVYLSDLSGLSASRKKDISERLEKLLLESPEKFLRQAIAQIKRDQEESGSQDRGRD